MKIAQELRAGNVIMVGKEPMVIQKTEYNKSGRNAAVVKIKMKGLLTGAGQESVYKADEKFEVLLAAWLLDAAVLQVAHAHLQSLRGAKAGVLQQRQSLPRSPECGRRAQRPSTGLLALPLARLTPALQVDGLAAPHAPQGAARPQAPVACLEAFGPPPELPRTGQN